MNAADDVAALRLQLLANGYSPLPGRDKRVFLKGWPSVRIDEAAILRWGRSRRDLATNLRIENGLCALDFDIDHPIMDEIADLVLDTLKELDHPDAPLLIRHGKGLKEAWFVRCDEPFSRMFTRRWIAPGQSADHCTHSIEIFGGASPRQFGAFGPHTRLDNGEVTVWYRWRDRSPLDTQLASLPLVPEARLSALIDAVERKLEAAGFTPVLRSVAGEGAETHVYDLTDDMVFECNDGFERTLAELKILVRRDDVGGLRCSASWLEGPTAKRRDRCLIGRNKHGELTVFESASGVTHMAAADAFDNTIVGAALLRRLHEIAEGTRR